MSGQHRRTESTETEVVLFLALIAHLSWGCVSVCVVSSASRFSFLLRALAASSLALTTVTLRGLASGGKGAAGLEATGVALLKEAGGEEVEDVDAEPEEARSTLSSDCFLILWSWDLRDVMSTLRGACWTTRNRHRDVFSMWSNDLLQFLQAGIIQGKAGYWFISNQVLCSTFCHWIIYYMYYRLEIKTVHPLPVIVDLYIKT